MTPSVKAMQKKTKLMRFSPHDTRKILRTLFCNIAYDHAANLGEWSLTPMNIHNNREVTNALSTF